MYVKNNELQPNGKVKRSKMSNCIILLKLSYQLILHRHTVKIIDLTNTLF